MINICEKNKCMGCGLCVDVCPKNAIKLQINMQGFLEPSIDKEKCINCKLCTSNCIGNEEKNINGNIPKNMYKAYTLCDEQRQSSSSGGIFSELASYIITNKGYVVSATMNRDFRVYHSVTNSLKEIEKFKKSKYLGSNLTNIYKTTKNLLIGNNLVMFVGTPCQVYAMKKYLGKNITDKIIFVDFICHGVNSYKIFDYYIEELNKKFKSKCIDFSFREKKPTYIDYSYRALMKNGKKEESIALSNLCGNLFGTRKTTRIACDLCKFSTEYRVSDITLSDYTFIKSEKIEKSELKKGVSFILINTDKGDNIFNCIKKNIYYKTRNDIEYLKNRTSHSKKYTISEKEKMLKELENDVNYFVKKSYDLSFFNKLVIKYSGPLTGNPLQLIIKVINRFKNKIKNKKETF